MAELKRTFRKGRMNKDLDERLVPDGEYRDAMNIEVSTSEDSNVGTIQTTLGNTLKSATGTTTAFTVGSISDTTTNKIYWMVYNDPDNVTKSGITRDMIIEYNPSKELVKYVFVDIWRVVTTIGTAAGAGSKFLYIPLGVGSTSTDNRTGVREGMRVTGSFNGVNVNYADDVIVEKVEFDGVTGGWKISLSEALQTVVGNVITFVAERTLNFSKNYLVTGINIVDDMLFWTDNNSEPKKINIIRSIKGTGGTSVLNSNATSTFGGENNNYHTRLVVTDPNATGGYRVATNRLSTYPVFTQESHLTVLRPAPQTTLELEMSRTSYNRGNAFTGVVNRTDAQANISFFTTSSSIMVAGDVISNVTFDQAADFRIGDILILTNDNTVSPTDFTNHEVRVEVTGIPQGHTHNNLMFGLFQIKILSITVDLAYNANGEQFFCLLEQKDSIFEFKFPKFSYRYKYTDGEYSSFAPWSEVAFLPGSFDYEPKKGHNLGMVNRLKALKLKKYVPEPGEIGSAKPSDVAEIDILYKESNSTNIYTVKTIKPTDPHPVWPDLVTKAYARGEMIIDTEMIHAILPSDQFLRPFDAVPRKAKAQEITGNRLLYGNYTQNYNYEEIIDIETSLDVGSYKYYIDNAQKSVKSMRDYQIGIVYLDKYGRETPVLVGNENGFQRVGKIFSDNYVKIRARAVNNPPSWAHAFKFYIKEPSNEYYNLAMDRWYNAKDGNIWLSFPSSERNKVDEETFLILKKAHDGNKSVAEETGKYKVLAIENEAPDYIKRDRKSLGTMHDNTAKTFIGNGGDGFPFPGFDHVEVPYAALNASSLVSIDSTGVPDPKSPHMQDNIFLKIHSDTNASVEYEIVTITNTGSGGNYKIRLRLPLGDDVEFTTTDGTYANRVSGLFLEIIQYKVENKAEFDGRFFVKIENDTLIQNRILGDKVKNIDKVVYSARNVRYVKAVDDHPKLANMTNANSSFGNNTFAYDWIGHGGIAFDDIDNNNGNKGYAYWKGFIDFNRNGNGSGFFIDDDNETSMPPLLAGLGTLATKDWTTVQITNGPSHKLATQDGQHGGGYGTYAGSEEPKGIWHFAGEPAGTRMDVSWVGFDDSGYGNNNTPNLWSQHGQDIQPEDYEFAKEWFQIGAEFRFAADDDETIYTVVDYRYEYGLRNFTTALGNKRNNGIVFRDKWTLKVDPPIQRTASGFYPLDIRHDGTQNSLVELVRSHPSESAKFTENPAIWETEPREDLDLDVYYEASVTFPTELNSDTNEMFAPIESTVSVTQGSVAIVSSDCKVFSWSNNVVTLSGSITDLIQGEIIEFTRPDGGKVEAKLKTIEVSTTDPTTGAIIATSLAFYKDVSNQKMTLCYSNCFSFPQGVESDRVRDDFNQVTLSKGVKASTVLAEQYKEEIRKSGLIFSGLYNSMNGVNNLNQFILSSGITKDLNNQYGSIQKLFTRDDNVVAFCEDKILRIYANKDALFNADGNTNLTATNRVLGTAEPFGGEFGISKNPESFASESFRAYFTDKARGAVLRLSKDGLTIISALGMEDYFRDNLHLSGDIIGSYDKRKSLYNLTLKDTTVSFSEKSKGWTSFKSFIPETALSLDNNYYTFKGGNVFLHHDNEQTNNFYGVAASLSNKAFSSVTVLLNDIPGSVKSFNTLNYEGTQSKIDLFQTVTVGGVSYNDGEFYNLDAKKGWYVDSMLTDMQTGRLKEFIEKEGKWFNYIYGEATNLSNLDSREFSYQGIGMAETISYTGSSTSNFILTVQDDPSDH